MHDLARVAALEARRVTWIELFFDLVFVAAIGQVGHPIGHVAGVAALGRQIFLLVLIWSAWHGYVGYATRFDPDAPRARACTLLQMVCVVFMAANADDVLGSQSTAGFVAAYGAMRVLLAVQFGACTAGQARLLGAWRNGLAISGSLWIISALVPSPWRFVGWGLAASVDVWLERVSLRAALATPPHADHLPERFGLFTLILLGEALVGVTRGIQGQPAWSVPAAGAALAGLAGVFAIWWGYFGRARATASRHVVTPADVRRLAGWTYAHLPLYLGVTALGVQLEMLVRAGERMVDGAHMMGPLLLAVGLVLGGLLGVGLAGPITISSAGARAGRA